MKNIPYEQNGWFGGGFPIFFGSKMDGENNEKPY